VIADIIAAYGDNAIAPDERTTNQIARAWDINAETARRRLRRMEQRGLVTGRRAYSAEDRHEVVVWRFAGAVD
jgi:DNA-binding Lrp family transcriptional regulator